jgi:hypothetical protein
LLIDSLLICFIDFIPSHTYIQPCLYIPLVDLIIFLIFLSFTSVTVNDFPYGTEGQNSDKLTPLRVHLSWVLKLLLHIILIGIEFNYLEK